MTENRLSIVLRKLKDQGECGLICYTVAGYPDMKTAAGVVDALVRGGADAIEIGIPFSDPIADGPSIQKAVSSALDRGVTPEKALEFSRHIRMRYPHLPIIGMTYYNILLSRGVARFIELAKKNGLDGFIIPDLPIEESQEFIQSSRQNGLATVFLVSPNTNAERLKIIADNTTGFVYLVSVYGITGSRKTFEEYSLQAVRFAKVETLGKVSVAVGFGISSASHVRVMKECGADAVIVGSAILDRIASTKRNQQLFTGLEKFAKSLKQACR